MAVQVATYQLGFDGGLLQRGFWLYGWEVTTPTGAVLHYVGRTGDSSSINAQSPFARMGQHLGFANTSMMLRKHLDARGVDPRECAFRLIAHGPVLPEADDKDIQVHRSRRDIVAAMECALCAELSAFGYTRRMAPPMIALSGASDTDKRVYLAQAWSLYSASLGRAGNLMRFHEIAMTMPSVRDALKLDVHRAIGFARLEGLIIPVVPGAPPIDFAKLTEGTYALTMANVNTAVKVAVLTIWHTTLETYLGWLLRLSAVCNRAWVISEVEKRQISYADLKAKGEQGAEDALIEGWLTEIGEKTLLIKWNKVMAGTPPTPEVRKSKVKYDVDWLRQFDEARHDAVHHDGKLATTFDIANANAVLFSYGFALLAQFARTYGLVLSHNIFVAAGQNAHAR